MSAKATLDRLTHTYTAGDGSSVSLCVSDVLRLSGICSPYPEIPSVMNHVEHARELGETVHEWCDFLDGHRGEMDVNDAIVILEGSEPLPYVLAYQRFREDYEVEWENIETSFTLEGCAGTPDRIGTIVRKEKRIPVIVDIKTPRQPEKHWQIQLSGYQWLANRLDCLLYVVHLASDATYKLRAYESDIGTFCAALRVAQWKVANGKK